jgi:hypothetical protein
MFGLVGKSPRRATGQLRWAAATRAGCASPAVLAVRRGLVRDGDHGTCWVNFEPPAAADLSSTARARARLVPRRQVPGRRREPQREPARPRLSRSPSARLWHLGRSSTGSGAHHVRRYRHCGANTVSLPAMNTSIVSILRSVLRLPSFSTICCQRQFRHFAVSMFYQQNTVPKFGHCSISGTGLHIWYKATGQSRTDRDIRPLRGMIGFQ